MPRLEFPLSQFLELSEQSDHALQTASIQEKQGDKNTPSKGCSNTRVNALSKKFSAKFPDCQ